ncbi:hypothetical protein HELRODRAFT_63880, partial [Helobdella robusta]|uniref:Vacuolar membrane-associated protein Iml1 N-terminal domain-containing protein n=1 Tax=Helobdella robusta TaxID=6412 RepID=T1FXL8_HELRO
MQILTQKELESVSLHHVELVFQDQYYSRSDMLRMRNFLMNKILFYEEKIELMKMRAKVEELWCNIKIDDIWYNFRVTCGLITDKTRVSFRSSSAQVHIFIQMSSEMWLFDNYGQLYFEKAVDGYLSHLFKLWREKKCSHDVTITLFSRTFYDAKSVDEFPECMKEWIREDNRGRFYEDFYWVVVQNDRNEDWSKTIGSLKTIFSTYDNDVLHFHEDKQLSRASFNSTSSDGNVLEVINMALNVYEKFYMDRSFERTGKMSMIITPGVGVFDVNRELMNITKQRSIDIGSSCDLICLGERPLFAVPLFRINQDHIRYPHLLVEDDYNIPHWLNLSYYNSNIQIEC